MPSALLITGRGQQPARKELIELGRILRTLDISIVILRARLHDASYPTHTIFYAWYYVRYNQSHLNPNKGKQGETGLMS